MQVTTLNTICVHVISHLCKILLKNYFYNYIYIAGNDLKYNMCICIFTFMYISFNK